MLEEISKYRVAKLAKEKGFDMFNHYSSQDIPEELRIVFFDTCTQSLLQKWLREIHNIDIFVCASVLANNVFKYSYYIIKNKSLDSDSDGCEENKYEEALELGLYEALKLI